MIVYQIAFSYSMPLPGVVEIAAESEARAREIFAEISKDMEKVVIADLREVGNTDDPPVEDDSLPQLHSSAPSNNKLN